VTLSNLALRSQEFDNAAWTNVQSTEVANDAIAPDGTLTAEKVVATAITSSGLRGFYNTTPITVVAGTQYRWSVYLKKGSVRYGRFGPEATPGSANKTVNVDLETCEATFFRNAVVSFTGRKVNNGWCYVSVVSSTNITNGYFDIGMAPTATWDSTSYSSTTSDYIYIWGASVQLATSPPDYLVTTSSATTLAGVCQEGRAIDLYNPKSCIEVGTSEFEFRTPDQINAGAINLCGNTPVVTAKQTFSNLVLRSEEFDNASWTKSGATVTANAVTAPDGTLTADTITANAGTAAHYFYAAVGNRPAAGTDERVSFFVKKGTHRYIGAFLPDVSDYGAVFDLDNMNEIYQSTNISRHSITAYKDGWYRIVLDYTRVSGASRIFYLSLRGDTSTTGIVPSWTATGTETVHVWGIQLNDQSNPPDYLATTSAAATLGPTCGAGSTPASFNPGVCAPVYAPNREIRTPLQIGN